MIVVRDQHLTCTDAAIAHNGQGAREHRAVDERLTPEQARGASREWWDTEADAYADEHGAFLGGGPGTPPGTDLVWCPEGLREADARLLGSPGSLAGCTVLEVGCGGAQAARWLATEGARVVGFDLSAGMLLRGREYGREAGVVVPLVQAGAEQMPFRIASVDLAVSAFGAVPHVADSSRVMREVARVLRPGGRWVFSTTHPMRWCFADDPGPAGLTVRTSYFDRSDYVEWTHSETGRRPSYVETHRTLGDRVREITAAGLVLDDLVEPPWVEGASQPWGQWSPLRGRLFPGTAIYLTRKPG